ncbi:MAG: hypothetical protein R3354_07135 [Thiohalomonadales bacterium]|nr:hypothetical protein [Thiohalomonadales bacterium]
MQNRRLFLNLLRLTSILLLICLFSPRGWADTDPQVSDFALFIQHTDMDWAYPVAVRETTSTRLLAVWHESFGASLKGGLRLAYLDLSQASNPLPSAKNSTGYGLGFDLHALILNQPSLQLGLLFAYDYQSTRGTSDNQVTDFVWHTGEVGADLVLAPNARLSVLSGISLTYIDGEQRVSGNLEQIIPFNEDETLGYYAGLDLKTDATGSIGIKWYGGSREGVEFVFRRQF